MVDATAALDCIAEVLAAPGWRRNDADNRALAGQLFRLRAQVDAALSAVTASAVEQGHCTGFKDSTTGTMGWLRGQTEQPLMSMELRAAVERGEAAGVLPELTALHREGSVTTGFLDAAVRGLRLLPADCAAVLDHALAEAAQTLPASFVPRLVRLVRSSLGLEADDGKFRHPNDGASEVWLSRYGSDDRYLLRGDLDTLGGAQLDAMLTRLSRPRDDQDWRTVSQRLGAALVQIVRLAAMAEGDDLTPGMVPPHGMDAHVVVRTTAETLTEQVGAPDAVTDDGAVIDRGQLAALLCHQPISTAVTARPAAMSGSSDAAPGDWSALRASTPACCRSRSATASSRSTSAAPPASPAGRSGWRCCFATRPASTPGAAAGRAGARRTTCSSGTPTRARRTWTISSCSAGSTTPGCTAPERTWFPPATAPIGWWTPRNGENSGPPPSSAGPRPPAPARPTGNRDRHPGVRPARAGGPAPEGLRACTEIT